MPSGSLTDKLAEALDRWAEQNPEPGPWSRLRARTNSRDATTAVLIVTSARRQIVLEWRKPGRL
jgi:hypothetical protein